MSYRYRQNDMHACKCYLLGEDNNVNAKQWETRADSWKSTSETAIGSLELDCWQVNNAGFVIFPKFSFMSTLWRRHVLNTLNIHLVDTNSAIWQLMLNVNITSVYLHKTSTGHLWDVVPSFQGFQEPHHTSGTPQRRYPLSKIIS